MFNMSSPAPMMPNGAVLPTKPTATAVSAGSSSSSSIKDSHFIDQSTTHINAKRKGLQILLGASIPGASHDSSARYPPPQCRPGTRQNYIDTIAYFGTDNNRRSSRMLWLKGSAGVGKSAVAQSSAETLGDRLAASFFFSRSNSRDDPNCFFTTISHQLATKFSAYGDILDTNISRNPTLVTRSIGRQFLDLIVTPLNELKERGELDIGNPVIVVDGLDECAGEKAQCDIIQIVANSARDQTTPFFWVFLSRPEPHIIAAFTSPQVSPLSLHMELPDLGEGFEERCTCGLGMKRNMEEEAKKWDDIAKREEVLKAWEEKLAAWDKDMQSKEERLKLDADRLAYLEVMMDEEMAQREERVTVREKSVEFREEAARRSENQLHERKIQVEKSESELKNCQQVVDELRGEATRLQNEVLAKEKDLTRRTAVLEFLEKRLDGVMGVLRDKGVSATSLRSYLSPSVTIAHRYSATTLDKLPSGVLLKIVLYLNFTNIHAFNLTCKTLYNVTATRAVYHKLAADLLRRCRRLPVKGFQSLTDLSTEQLIRSVNQANRFDIAWRRRAPRPVGPFAGIFGASCYMEGSQDPSRSWYKVSNAPEAELDWLGTIFTDYLLCATKNGKVTCWDIHSNTCLGEWNQGKQWLIWKCCEERGERAMLFIMARCLDKTQGDNRVTEFILIRLEFSDQHSGGSSREKATFSCVTEFRITGRFTNIFFTDTSKRRLCATLWLASSDTIGLYVLLDWNKSEHVSIDTGIEFPPSARVVCGLHDQYIVVHRQEPDAVHEYFYPFSLLITHLSPSRDHLSQGIKHRVIPARALARRFVFPRIPSTSSDTNGHAGNANGDTIMLDDLPIHRPIQPNPSHRQITGPVLYSTNPFPWPRWSLGSARFLRLWPSSIPGIPEVNSAIMLLTMDDEGTNLNCWVLAQHYFKVPIDPETWARGENSKPIVELCKSTTLLPGEEKEDDGLMKMWYVSKPFEVVKVLDNVDDAVPHWSPLLAVDFGHAVWMEYCGEVLGDETASTGTGPSDDGPFYDSASDDWLDEGGRSGARAGGKDGGRRKELKFVTFPSYEGDEEQYQDWNGDMESMSSEGSSPFLLTNGKRDIKANQKKQRETEGVVRTLAVPDELDLDMVETLSFDQAQGAVVISDRKGKIFILCYE